MKDSMEK